MSVHGPGEKKGSSHNKDSGFRHSEAGGKSPSGGGSAPGATSVGRDISKADRTVGVGDFKPSSSVRKVSDSEFVRREAT